MCVDIEEEKKAMSISFMTFLFYNTKKYPFGRDDFKFQKAPISMTIFPLNAGVWQKATAPGQSYDQGDNWYCEDSVFLDYEV